jgi:hypothetical protein
MTECNRYREWIPKSLLGDLGSVERQELERHLAECLPCRAEQDLYATTLGHLRNAPDEAAPRHFFVYEEQARRSPWRLFREMALAWQGAIAAATILLCVVSASAAMHLQVRREGSALTLGFGPLPAKEVVMPPAAVDTNALEARILKAVEEKNQRETLQWVKTLRAEAAAARRNLTPQQAAVLEAALSRLQTRMEDNLSSAVSSIRANNEKSMADMYQAISARRQTDLNMIDRRISSVAATGEMKSNQTDAILETLLQVAELNIK